MLTEHMIKEEVDTEGNDNIQDSSFDFEPLMHDVDANNSGGMKDMSNMNITGNFTSPPSEQSFESQAGPSSMHTWANVHEADASNQGFSGDMDMTGQQRSHGQQHQHHMMTSKPMVRILQFPNSDAPRGVGKKKKSKVAQPPKKEEDSSWDDITYEVIPSSSKSAKDKLYDSLGYSYIKRRQSIDGSIQWRCPMRNRNVSYCPACVTQKDCVYTRNGRDHTHPPKVGLKKAVQVQMKINEMSKEQPHKSTARIIQDVMLEEDLVTQPCAALPSVDTLVHVSNRRRQKMRPQEPSDLEFELLVDNLPEDFLRGDLLVDNHRHVVFASEAQMDLLAQAECWYIDSTFRVIKKPFEHMLSINVFVQKDGKAKQVPLLFAFMSGYSREDYEAVLLCVLGLQEKYAVQTAVLNFEEAIWRAFAMIMPNVELRGCAFHWGQAVMEKVQELGLQPSYSEDPEVRLLIRKLLALRFLPPQHIEPMFERLTTDINTPELMTFADYIADTFIYGTVWTPSSWSVYSMAIRTNNDLEGWQKELTSRGRVQLAFYSLVDLLNKQGQLAKYVEIIECDQLKQLQRQQYQKFHDKLFKTWEEYEEGHIDNMNLVTICAGLFRPVLSKE